MASMPLARAFRAPQKKRGFLNGKRWGVKIIGGCFPKACDMPFGGAPGRECGARLDKTPWFNGEDREWADNEKPLALKIRGAASWRFSETARVLGSGALGVFFGDAFGKCPVLAD